MSWFTVSLRINERSRNQFLVWRKHQRYPAPTPDDFVQLRMRLDIASNAKASFVRLIDFDRLRCYINCCDTVVLTPVLNEIVNDLLFLWAELCLIGVGGSATGAHKQ